MRIERFRAHFVSFLFPMSILSHLKNALYICVRIYIWMFRFFLNIVFRLFAHFGAFVVVVVVLFQLILFFFEIEYSTFRE